MDPQTRAILIEMNRPRHLIPQKSHEKRGQHEQIKPKFKTQLIQKSRRVFKKKVHKKLNLKEKWKSFKDSIPKRKCTVKCCKSFFHELFPFIDIMQNYSMRRYLLADLIAGLTVGIIHIPQGMAYGLLANLPPVYGLYTSFFPVFLYFFFGSSRHISIGTFAVTSLMVGSVVQKGYNSYLTKLGIDPDAVILNANDTAHSNYTRTYINSNLTFRLELPIPQVIPPEAELVKIGYAMSITFLVGLFQLIFGCFRLGFLALFLSDPFISGFTTGAAIHVFSSQVKYLFGVPVTFYTGPFKLIYFYTEFFSRLRLVNPVTITASVTCIFVLILVKEGINSNPSCKDNLPVPVPIELIVVISATVISYYTKIGPDFHVEVVGTIPKGLPSANIDNLYYMYDVIWESITLTFLAFAISYSMAKILAEKHNYHINENQELVANGMCNLIGPLFGSFCCSASLSRSLVQSSAGGFTQMVGLFSCLLVLVVLLYIGPLFHALPNVKQRNSIPIRKWHVYNVLILDSHFFIINLLYLFHHLLCILACIVIVTLKGMFKQFYDMVKLWRLCKRDFAVWFVTFLATVIFDVGLGLMLGFVFALYFVLRSSQRPRICILGHVPGTSTYKDITVNRRVEPVPGVQIFRFEAPLYFANAEQFRDRLYEKTSLNPKKLKGKKQKALYKALMQRKREMELQEAEERLARRKSKKYKRPDPPQRSSIEEEEELPEELTEQQESLLAKEKKEILQRFSKAWIPPVHTLIIDLSVVSYVDTVSLKILTQIINDYKEVGIKVFLAGCRDEVRTMLRKADFYRSVDYNCLYFTVHEAVVIAQELQAIRKLEDELSIENEKKQKEERANPNIPLPMNFEPMRFENIEV